MNKENDLRELVKKILKLSKEQQKIVNAFVEGVQYGNLKEKAKGA